MTISYYDRNAEDFFRNTVDVDMTEIYNEFTSLLPEKAKIIDLGCGAGRDVLYFKKLGYNIIGVDNSPEIVRLASKYTKENIILQDFTKLDYREEFDGIWACASLLHFSKTKLISVIEKIIEYIRKSGIIYTSFKYGDSEGVRNGRYFSDFTERSFSTLVLKSKIQIIKMWTTNDRRPDRNTQWLNIILARK